MPEVGVGDVIDDYCSRCRFLSGHSIVAIVNEAIRRVRCRTCDFEHDYRRGRGGAKKVKPMSAFEQVLASLNPAAMAGDDKTRRRRER